MAKQNLQVRVHKGTLEKIDAIRMPDGKLAISRSAFIEIMINKWFLYKGPWEWLVSPNQIRLKKDDICTIHVSVTKDCWTRYQKAKRYLRKKHAIVKTSLAILESSFQFWVNTNGD